MTATKEVEDIQPVPLEQVSLDGLPVPVDLMGQTYEEAPASPGTRYPWFSRR